MCGIFGSTKFEQFRTLYRLNQSRGDFAYGGLYSNEDNHILEKYEGNKPFPTPKNATKYVNFLGHTQAPTSSKRNFSPETTHPFTHKNWTVAHNGVLSNAEELKRKFLLTNTNEVDTSCIPALMSYFYVDTGDTHTDEVRAITTSLQQLEGTYGCWIYNKLSRNIYLARSGSTLYYEVTGNFSSALDPYSHYKTVPEGTLLKIKGTSVHEAGSFSFDSPYFIL